MRSTTSGTGARRGVVVPAAAASRVASSRNVRGAFVGAMTGRPQAASVLAAAAIAATMSGR
ncbi:MAG: hypothetical protein NVV66_05380 [Cellulomonas sp.]|uniref:hypothetical protein n=1 Tax=Cellulomonas sp. TaxID=40001 RepID=UPI002587611D|nr:hypothetical protein [Cellulomonas sp.]MCR6704127.1 hypothetical protein [Cellulomonas sp.]